MKRFLIRLQAMARAFKVRHTFKDTRLAMQRPLRIFLNRGIDLPIADWDNQKADPYVIFTVLDEKDRQIHRFDSETQYDNLDPTFEEDFVLPGCTGMSKVVVTVIDQDELRDQFMGQAILHLQKTWRTGGKFRLELDELLYMPKSVSGSDVRFDFGTIEPQGSIELEVMPMDGIVNHCGYLLGPPLDDESVAASHVKQDLARLRKCWCMIADHKLYVYGALGSPVARLVLDLKLCSCSIEGARSDKQPYCITFVNEKQSQYIFKCPKTKEQDIWRTAFECSYDLHTHKRHPGQTRVAAAIELMKRKKKKKAGTRTPAKPDGGGGEGEGGGAGAGAGGGGGGGGGDRTQPKSLKGRGSTGRGSTMSQRSIPGKEAAAPKSGGDASVTVKSGIVKTQLTIASDREVDEDMLEARGGDELLLTPTIMKRHRDTTSNLNKKTVSLTAAQFRERKRLEVENSEIKEEDRLKQDISDQSRRDSAIEYEFKKAFKGEGVERTKFPALQRMSANSSSALFGVTAVAKNPPSVKEFKLNKSRRNLNESRRNLVADANEVKMKKMLRRGTVKF